MSIEGQSHIVTIYFAGFFTSLLFYYYLYILCFIRPMYQVSVYRTIGPLVMFYYLLDTDRSKAGVLV